MSHNHEQSNPVSYDNRQLVGLVPYPLVMGYCDPVPLADKSQPFLVRSVRSKMVVMRFDRDAGGFEDTRKLPPKIAVSEQNNAQAARS